MNLVDELLGLVESLNGAGVEYAVCGGIAVAIHGHPRFTKDIDVLIAASDLGQVRNTVRNRGFVLEGGRLCFGAGTQSEREMCIRTSARHRGRGSSHRTGEGGSS